MVVRSFPGAWGRCWQPNKSRAKLTHFHAFGRLLSHTETSCLTRPVMTSAVGPRPALEAERSREREAVVLKQAPSAISKKKKLESACCGEQRRGSREREGQPWRGGRGPRGGVVVVALNTKKSNKIRPLAVRPTRQRHSCPPHWSQIMVRLDAPWFQNCLVPCLAPRNG